MILLDTPNAESFARRIRERFYGNTQVLKGQVRMERKNGHRFITEMVEHPWRSLGDFGKQSRRWRTSSYAAPDISSGPKPARKLKYDHFYSLSSWVYAPLMGIGWIAENGSVTTVEASSRPSSC